jgi:small subunit ribosomal protein S16
LPTGGTAQLPQTCFHAIIEGFLQKIAVRELLASASFEGNVNMVVIRLNRGGAKNRPFFNIVVTDSRNRRDGAFIERLGFYNPKAAANEEGLRIAVDRVTYWTGVGAQVSPTVARLVKDLSKKVPAAAA